MSSNNHILPPILKEFCFDKSSQNGFKENFDKFLEFFLSPDSFNQKIKLKAVFQDSIDYGELDVLTDFLVCVKNIRLVKEIPSKQSQIKILKALQAITKITKTIFFDNNELDQAIKEGFCIFETNQVKKLAFTFIDFANAWVYEEIYESLNKLPLESLELEFIYKKYIDTTIIKHMILFSNEILCESIKIFSILFQNFTLDHSFTFPDIDKNEGIFFTKITNFINLECLSLIIDRSKFLNEDLNYLLTYIADNKFLKLTRLNLEFRDFFGDKEDGGISLSNQEITLNYMLKNLYKSKLYCFSLAFFNCSIENLKIFLNIETKIMNITEFALKFVRDDDIEDCSNDFFSCMLQFLDNFINLNKLELDFRNPKNFSFDEYSKLLDSSIFEKVEYLRLFIKLVSSDQVYKDFDEKDVINKIFKKINELKNLKYLLLDLNDAKFNKSAYSTWFPDLDNLENLTIAAFDLADLYYGNINNTSFEEALVELQKKYGKLENYKIFHHHEENAQLYTKEFFSNYYYQIDYLFNDKVKGIFDLDYGHYKPNLLEFNIFINNCELLDNFTSLDEFYSELYHEFFIRDLSIDFFNTSIQHIKNNDFKSDDDLIKTIYTKKFNFDKLLPYNNEEFQFFDIIRPEHNNYYLRSLEQFNKRAFFFFSDTETDWFFERPNYIKDYIKNPIFVANFRVQDFENYMNIFHIDDKINKTNFVNTLFIIHLNMNCPSNLPHSILECDEYCKYVTCESLSFLLYYAQTVQKSINDKENIHHKKLQSIKSINLQSNPYFSSRSCKETLLSLVDENWKLIKLRSPQYFINNDLFKFKKFPFENKKISNTFRKANPIQNSINNFYTSIRSTIKNFEIAELDDFYGNFFLDLIDWLPSLKNINLSNQNLGDRFCERFNKLTTRYLESNKLKFINLEMINNFRITNVGLKYMYVSFQILQRYFKDKGETILPNLKIMGFRKKEVEIKKELFKSKKKNANLIKVSTIPNSPMILPENNLIETDQLINIPVNKSPENQEPASSELNEKNNENEEHKIIKTEVKTENEIWEFDQKKESIAKTIILNEGLGSFLQNFIVGLMMPKRFFCHHCDKEVCKVCHTNHDRFISCIPDFIICNNCADIHHKNLLDCNLKKETHEICKGFREILERKKKKFKKKANTKPNQFLEGLKKSIQLLLACLTAITMSLNKMLQIFILFIRNNCERCCIKKNIDEASKQTLKCYKFLNCFFGDPSQIQDEGKEFKFNVNVLNLNKSLGKKLLIFLFSLNFVIYYGLVATVPYFFQGKTDTVSWTSHYIYASYAFCIVIFESYLCAHIISTVNAGKNNKILRDFSLVNYLIPLVLSQIKKYDFYTDVIFILQNFKEGRYKIGYLLIACLGTTSFFNLIMIISILKTLWGINFKKLFMKCINKCRGKKISDSSYENSEYSKVSTYNINLFCKISSLLELECVANCLDKFSTKNAWFLPILGGYYIPQAIIGAIWKFTFEDLPSFIIQMIVLFLYTDLKNVISLLPIIISTIISLISSVATTLLAKACVLQPKELKLLDDRKEIEEENPINEDFENNDRQFVCGVGLPNYNDGDDNKEIEYDNNEEKEGNNEINEGEIENNDEENNDKNEEENNENEEIEKNEDLNDNWANDPQEKEIAEVNNPNWEDEINI